MYKVKFYRKDNRTGKKFRENYDSENPNNRKISQIRFFPYRSSIMRSFEKNLKNNEGKHKNSRGLFKTDYSFENLSSEGRKEIKSRYKDGFSSPLIKVDFMGCIRRANGGSINAGYFMERSGIFVRDCGWVFGDDKKTFTVIPYKFKNGFEIKGVTKGIHSLDNILDWKLIDNYVLTGEYGK